MPELSHSPCLTSILERLFRGLSGCQLTEQGWAFVILRGAAIRAGSQRLSVGTDSGVADGLTHSLLDIEALILRCHCWLISVLLSPRYESSIERFGSSIADGRAARVCASQ